MTGTWQLVRLALRRDRWLLPLWVIGLGLLRHRRSAAASTSLYPDQASLESFAASMSNPSLSAFYGPIFAVNLGGHHRLAVQHRAARSARWPSA